MNTKETLREMVRISEAYSDKVFQNACASECIKALEDKCEAQRNLLLKIVADLPTVEVK